jgi:hypothetical protein
VTHREPARRMSRAECMLISARGLNWRKVFLAMFTVYVDDSGTSPNQKVAVATALIVPAQKIVAMESEWRRFKEKERFSCFHMSEFVARNPKSDFAYWDNKKHQHVFNRVLQIARKYSAQGYSFTLNKQDYDDVVIGDWRTLFGKHHYTWALRHTLSFADGWRRSKRKLPPFEYVFDWEKPSDPRRKEIDKMMELAESLSLESGKEPGEFTNYSFRHLKDFAGLQIVDMIGWISYQIGLRNFNLISLPAHPFVQQAASDFASSRKWIVLFTVTRDSLQEWFKKESHTEQSQKFMKKWLEVKSRKSRN